MGLDRLGVIPAAGNSSRFLGYPKELLPANRYESLLWRVVSSLNKYTDEVLLITNPDKMLLHNWICQDQVIYRHQSLDRDIWGAMIESFSIDASMYLFQMPDTCIPRDTWYRDLDHDFILGTFQTDMPERFGVISRGKVINKKKRKTLPATAWGVLAWSRKVVQFWVDHLREIKDYTDAINKAMEEFGYETFELHYYYDMATFQDYCKFIKETGDGSII